MKPVSSSRYLVEKRNGLAFGMRPVMRRTLPNAKCIGSYLYITLNILRKPVPISCPLAPLQALGEGRTSTLAPEAIKFLNVFSAQPKRDDSEYAKRAVNEPPT